MKIKREVVAKTIEKNIYKKLHIVLDTTDKNGYRIITACAVRPFARRIMKNNLRRTYSEYQISSSVVSGYDMMNDATTHGLDSVVIKCYDKTRLSVKGKSRIGYSQWGLDKDSYNTTLTRNFSINLDFETGEYTVEKTSFENEKLEFVKKKLSDTSMKAIAREHKNGYIVLELNLGTNNISISGNVKHFNDIPKMVRLLKRSNTNHLYLSTETLAYNMAEVCHIDDCSRPYAVLSTLKMFNKLGAYARAVGTDVDKHIKFITDNKLTINHKNTPLYQSIADIEVFPAIDMIDYILERHTRIFLRESPNFEELAVSNFSNSDTDMLVMALRELSAKTNNVEFVIRMYYLIKYVQENHAFPLDISILPQVVLDIISNDIR